jgi:hypothetical protein
MFGCQNTPVKLPCRGRTCFTASWLDKQCLKSFAFYPIQRMVSVGSFIRNEESLYSNTARTLKSISSSAAS